jgi:glycosyltransferase involved in cell wall biosynthesis
MSGCGTSSDTVLPLVTIVTAVFNGARHLPALIDSVQGQDYPCIEHVVVDDGSNDGGATVAVLRSYGHLRWWSQDNQGQYAAQNAGMAAAQGSIVGVIAADDCYVTPSAIRKAVTFLEQHPSCDCVYGDVVDIGEDGRPKAPQWRPSGPMMARLLKYYCTIPHCALFVRRRALLRTGAIFDPSFRYCGDWDWELRLQHGGAVYGYLGEPIALYRKHETQVSATRSEALASEEHARILAAYGGGSLSVWLVGHTLNAQSLAVKALLAFRSGGAGKVIQTFRAWSLRELASARDRRARR